MYTHIYVYIYIILHVYIYIHEHIYIYVCMLYEYMYKQISLKLKSTRMWFIYIYMWPFLIFRIWFLISGVSTNYPLLCFRPFVCFSLIYIHIHVWNCRARGWLRFQPTSLKPAKHSSWVLCAPTYLHAHTHSHTHTHIHTHTYTHTHTHTGCVGHWVCLCVFVCVCGGGGCMPPGKHNGSAQCWFVAVCVALCCCIVTQRCTVLVCRDLRSRTWVPTKCCSVLKRVLQSFAGCCGMCSSVYCMPERFALKKACLNVVLQCVLQHVLQEELQCVLQDVLQCVLNVCGIRTQEREFESCVAVVLQSLLWSLLQSVLNLRLFRAQERNFESHTTNSLLSAKWLRHVTNLV